MNKKFIYLAIAATLAMPQLLKAQNVGIGTTTPTTTLEVSSNKKVSFKSSTDSARGAILANPDFINFPAAIKGEYSATGNNDGSGILGIATSPNQYYGTGVTGVGNWIGVLGIGNTDADAAIVAEANGASYGLRVVGNSIFTNNVNINGEAIIGTDAYVGGALNVEDVNASYDVNALGNVSVGGTITIEGGTPGVGKVLTSTGTSGAATWQIPVTTVTMPPMGFAVVKLSDLVATSGGGNQAVHFGTQIYNQGSAYFNATSHFTTPAAGFYHFDIMLGFDNFMGTSANTGMVHIELYDATTLDAIYNYQFTPKLSDSGTKGFSTTIPLAASQGVRVRVRNNSNGSITVQGSSTSNKSTYLCYRVH